MDTYTSPLGIKPLRKAITTYHGSSERRAIDANSILITPGVRQALIISLMCVLESGDEVIMFSPYFPSYPSMVMLAHQDVTIRYYTLEQGKSSLDKDKLMNLISDKTKVIVSNFPHNPTGKVLDEDAYNLLVNIASEKNIYIITDEIYEKVVFVDEKKSYLLSASEEIKDLCFVVSGFSKSHAMTGWRLGYMIYPEKFKTLAAKISLHMNACTNTFIQYGALNLFDLPPTYLEANNKNLISNRDLLRDLVEKLGMEWFYPESGYFAFVSIEGSGLNSNQFCHNLVLEEGVALTPGYAFGDDWDDYIRISFAVDEGDFNQALIRMERFFKKNGL